ncbi:maleylpyruvate isomerase [Saccharothrix violaceirubra]|uniref:Maleylpyruvate isomerase n=1 Tax=Saccharothrix violaceirubra TaxID=413306 RepID=A0A7W7WUY8_9PSEU|nr:maleylpyruvate isomerase [Saccharothrix violaceirubra]
MSSTDAAQVRSAGTTVPAPREQSAAAQDAVAGIAEVRRAGQVLYEVVERLDQSALRGPSLLPGWTRGHVVSHLARNADALVNLLTWAKTGVEHPMYPSAADREADIEEGSGRAPQLMRADLDAACRRFLVAAADLPATAWEAEVATRLGPLLAHRVPWLRVRELWVHLVDLDAGFGFEGVPDDLVEGYIDEVVTAFTGHAHAPSVTIEATFPDGRQRTWPLGSGSAGESRTVSGSAAAVLGWLTGRHSGAELNGTAPTLPKWL